VYALCQAPLIGIDFISPDISRPYREQKCAILEVNSLPYIDMHHYPVSGKERNVAGQVLDYFMSLNVV
jgi:cyanophycin synthetase